MSLAKWKQLETQKPQFLKPLSWTQFLVPGSDGAVDEIQDESDNKKRKYGGIKSNWTRSLLEYKDAEEQRAAAVKEQADYEARLRRTARLQLRNRERLLKVPVVRSPSHAQSSSILDGTRHSPSPSPSPSPPKNARSLSAMNATSSPTSPSPGVVQRPISCQDFTKFTDYCFPEEMEKYREIISAAATLKYQKRCEGRMEAELQRCETLKSKLDDGDKKLQERMTKEDKEKQAKIRGDARTLQNKILKTCQAKETIMLNKQLAVDEDRARRDERAERTRQRLKDEATISENALAMKAKRDRAWQQVGENRRQKDRAEDELRDTLDKEDHDAKERYSTTFQQKRDKLRQDWENWRTNASACENRRHEQLDEKLQKIEKDDNKREERKRAHEKAMQEQAQARQAEMTRRNKRAQDGIKRIQDEFTRWAEEKRTRREEATRKGEERIEAHHAEVRERLAQQAAEIERKVAQCHKRRALQSDDLAAALDREMKEAEVRHTRLIKWKSEKAGELVPESRMGRKEESLLGVSEKLVAEIEAKEQKTQQLKTEIRHELEEKQKAADAKWKKGVMRGVTTRNETMRNFITKAQKDLEKSEAQQRAIMEKRKAEAQALAESVEQRYREANERLFRANEEKDRQWQIRSAKIYGALDGSEMSPAEKRKQEKLMEASQHAASMQKPVVLDRKAIIAAERRDRTLEAMKQEALQVAERDKQRREEEAQSRKQKASKVKKITDAVAEMQRQREQQLHKQWENTTEKLEAARQRLEEKEKQRVDAVQAAQGRGGIRYAAALRAREEFLARTQESLDRKFDRSRCIERWFAKGGVSPSDPEGVLSTPTLSATTPPVHSPMSPTSP